MISMLLVDEEVIIWVEALSKSVPNSRPVAAPRTRRTSSKTECRSVSELQRLITVQGPERRRPGTHRPETRAADPHGATPQWRNPPQATRDIRRPTEDIHISYGAPSNKKVRGKISSANGAKEDHGIQISRTDAADFTPVCHKTSPTTETENSSL